MHICHENATFLTVKNHLCTIGHTVYDPDMAEAPRVFYFYLLYCTYIAQRCDFFELILTN